MWRLLEIIALSAVVLLAVTEFFYPLLAGKPFFGSFRKKKKVVSDADTHTLDEKLGKAREKVRDIKDVQDEVNQHYKSAEQLKREADELLGKKDKPGGNYFNEN